MISDFPGSPGSTGRYQGSPTAMSANSPLWSGFAALNGSAHRTALAASVVQNILAQNPAKRKDWTRTRFFAFDACC